MAHEFDALLARVEDDSLRADLRRQMRLLRAKRRFGLVFEDHIPERVLLPDHPIRRGVRVIHQDRDALTSFAVTRIEDGHVTLADKAGAEEIVEGIDDLVVIAEFGEPVYPGLKRVESISRGGNKPAHIVIDGENYHALQTLAFSHTAKVDCIYIDPPYNTGARDWKYDNNYVDSDDAYRHSKWLAFMERRLRLAKVLLKPESSVLIVTIDEKEYLRLGMLLVTCSPVASPV